MEALLNSGERMMDTDGSMECVDLGTVSLGVDATPEVSKVPVVGARDGVVKIGDIHFASEPPIAELVGLSFEGQGGSIQLRSNEGLSVTVTFNPTAAGTYVFGVEAVWGGRSAGMGVAQRSLDFTLLVGDAASRVLVGTEIEGGVTKLTSHKEQRVVCRSARTGAVSARTPPLPRMAPGVTATPGFDGSLYYLCYEGTLRELLVAHKQWDIRVARGNKKNSHVVEGRRRYRAHPRRARHSLLRAQGRDLGRGRGP
jgi:hypothetical protein